MNYPFSYSTDVNVDLSSHDAFNEGAPFATFDRMREHEAITWCAEKDGPGFWSVTRHADIMALNKNTELLSSAQGIRIESQSEEEYEARKTFQEIDPPHHTYFRMLVNKAFSKAEVSKYENQIRNITRELIIEHLDAGEFDATEKISRQLPMRMLGLIMGLPEKDMAFLVEKGDALLSNSDPDYTDFVVDQVDTDEYRLLPFRSPAAVDLFDYADDLFKRMEKGEQFGVLNHVIKEDKAGNKISNGQFRNFFCLLVAAGNDTTRFSISASIHALANFPHLHEQLRSADAATNLAAADELIRWASPTTHFRRTATEDFEHEGQLIKKGDKVVLWFLSGNRDANVFDKPYEISFARGRNAFMSFGQGGPHVCLGMFLAKLEVRIVIEELAKLVGKIEQTKRHSYLRSNFILGIKKLPVKMTAA